MKTAGFSPARNFPLSPRGWMLCLAGVLGCQPLFGCHANVNRSVAALPGPTESALPAGLSCDRCLWFERSDCLRAAASQIIAIVQDARLVESAGSCYPADPGPSFPSVCRYFGVYRFGRVDYSNNELAATSSDSFETIFRYDEVYTSDVHSHPFTGVRLQPDKRYMIFGGSHRKDIGLPADWYISLACELSN